MSEILTEADTREIAQRTQDRRLWADGKKTDYQFAYTLDERRVVDYIATMTNDSIGGGDDPIGFLIASHQFQAAEIKTERQSNIRKDNRIRELEAAVRRRALGQN